MMTDPSPRPMMIRLPWAGTVVAVACLAIASARFADANSKQSAPAPRPAPHPVMSAPRPQMGGGAPHLPGNMGGGPHLPGNMAGHYPGGGGGGGVGSGAHLPSNMGHAPPHTVGMAQHQTQSRTQPQRAETQRTRPEEGRRQTEGGRGGHPEEGRHDTAGGREERGNASHSETARDERGNQSGVAHGGPRQHTAEAKKTLSPGQTPHGYAAKYDSRLGGSARLNTRGLREAMSMPHAPRPFLHAPAHRDIAGDHAFAAAHAHDFHVRDVRGFTPRELSVWRGGRWHNEWHYGRRGWWWEVDGVWYGYPEPIWPYPVEVADLTVYDTPVIDGPDLTAYEEPVAAPDATTTEDAAAEPPADQPPADQPQADQSAQQVAAVIPPLPPAPAGWFRCEQPGGYYPGVNACGTGWTLVQTAPLPGEQ